MASSSVVQKRGTRNISPEDLLFLLRHDVNRSTRLKEFLSWKDVRKNAKASGGSGAENNTNGTAAGSENNLDDSGLVAEIEEDAKTLAAADDLNFDEEKEKDEDEDEDRGKIKISQSTSLNSNVQIGPKRRHLGLFWDLGHSLLADLPGTSGNFNDGTSITSYDSRDQATCYRETLRRLRYADLVTLSMSQAEYMEYSECRQASFTYKKGRKFREWLVGGTARIGTLALGTIASGSARDLTRLTDDTMEILGFLAYEIVQKLTEVSLAVKYESEKRERNREIENKLESEIERRTSMFDSNKFKSENETNNFTKFKSKPNNCIPTNSSSFNSIFILKNDETQTQSTPETFTCNKLQKFKELKSNPKLTLKTAIQVNHVEEAYRRLISINVDSHHLNRHGLNKKRKFIL